MPGAVIAKSSIDEVKKKRAISPLAGKLAPKEMLVDVAQRHLDTLVNEAQRIVDNALL